MEMQQTASEMRRHIIDKASMDIEFRQSLMADPRSAIESELDVVLPEDVSISVVEESETETYLVIPPTPILSESDLEQIAGGCKSFTPWYCS